MNASDDLYLIRFYKRRNCMPQQVSLEMYQFPEMLFSSNVPDFISKVNRNTEYAEFFLLLQRRIIPKKVEYFDKLKKDIQVRFGSRGTIADRTPGLVGNLLNPTSVCMFCSVSSPEELDEIRSLLSRTKSPGKKITAFVFNHGYEHLDVITHQSIFYFDLNDFTLFGKKRDYLQQSFSDERFDLLISFIFHYDLFCIKMISEIDAEFKIGPVLPEMNGIYDLTIKYKKDLFTYESFYDQVIHYLNVLNINVRTVNG